MSAPIVSMPEPSPLASMRRAIVREVLDGDKPSSVVVMLNPTTSPETIDMVVRDLGVFGKTNGPYLGMRDYSVVVMPKDGKSGRALYDYCLDNPSYIERVDPTERLIADSYSPSKSV